MIPKYTVEYSTNFRRQGHTNHYSTDDPVTCEEFIEHLLDEGYIVKAVKHEGLNLEQAAFDKIVRGAANQLASRKVCASLGIKPEEERFRFGFAA
jgi:hypothetical protein